MKLELNSHALATEYLAKSDYLLETSNMVFSDWILYTFFRNNNGVITATYAVMKKMCSIEKPLFETNDFEKLKSWVNSHSKELEEQIQTKEKEWIETWQK